MVVDAPFADFDAQFIGRYIFERVRFIKDHGLIVRQQLGPLAAQSEVAEKERVIDD